MKKLVLTCSDVQSWVLIETRDDKESILDFGNIRYDINSYLQTGIRELYTLLYSLQYDLILFELPDDLRECFHKGNLINRHETYSAIKTLVSIISMSGKARVEYFPVNYYHFYMKVDYQLLDLGELYLAGQKLFNGIMHNLRLEDSNCVRCVIMNYIYTSWLNTDFNNERPN